MTTLRELSRDVAQLRHDVATATSLGEKIIVICRGDSDQAKAAGRAEWEDRKGFKISSGADVLHLCIICGDGPDTGL